MALRTVYCLKGSMKISTRTKQASRAALFTAWGSIGPKRKAWQSVSAAVAAAVWYSRLDVYGGRGEGALLCGWTIVRSGRSSEVLRYNSRRHEGCSFGVRVLMRGTRFRVQQ